MRDDCDIGHDDDDGVADADDDDDDDDDDDTSAGTTPKHGQGVGSCFLVHCRHVVV